MAVTGRWGGYAKAVLRGIAAGIPIVGPAVAEVLKHAEEKKLEAKVDALVQRAARGEKSRARTLLALPEEEVEKAVAESIARLPKADRDRLAEEVQAASDAEEAVGAAITVLANAPVVRHSLLSYACRRIGDGHVLAPGDRIDSRYEVIELVGAGGMGSVYRARDLDLEEDVVVKFLRTELAKDSACARRFVQEAKVGLSLTHEGIVRIRDVRKSGETSYLTMEWVEGPTLRAFLGGRGTLAWKDAEPIARGVLTALAYAHGKGVLHLDLKPENVLLPRPDLPKLCDFGLARVAEQAGGASLLPGAGTPHYMAPEQARGDDLDARADVFAAGVMLYEMLSGELPVGVFEPLPKSVPLHVREGIAAALSQRKDKRPRDGAALLGLLGLRVGSAAVPGKKQPPATQEREEGKIATGGGFGGIGVDAALEELKMLEASLSLRSLSYLGKNIQGYEEYRNEKDGSPLVLIPAGKFLVQRNEPARHRPAKSVMLDRYLLGKTPVTNAQYRRYCQETGAKPPLEIDTRWGDPFSFTDPQFGDHPVVAITWDEARSYAQWAGADLPTQAQWEKAAGWDERSGHMLKYPWGEEEPDPRRAAFGRLPGEGSYTCPVGSLPEGASPYGVLDMVGNVSNWCLDFHDRVSVAWNPVNDDARSRRTPHIVRGGNWSMPASFMRVAFHAMAQADHASATLGFRIARSV